MCVITPSFPGWLNNVKNKKEVPIYIRKGVSLRDPEAKDLSSKLAVVSKDKLEKLLSELGLTPAQALKLFKLDFDEDYL